MTGEKRKIVSNLSNLMITDLKNLSSLMKPLSKPLFQTNNNLTNDLLTINDQSVIAFLTRLLSHLLRAAQNKSLISQILTIISKITISLNILKDSTQYLQKSNNLQPLPNIENSINGSQPLGQILYLIINILCLLRLQQDQQYQLRIIQSAFSLIDNKLLLYMDDNLIIRLYSVCFGCCMGSTLVQNISVSALFALTEAIFNSDKVEGCLNILQCFTQYLFEGKKFIWMSDISLKGLVWDLVIVAIKKMSQQTVSNIKCDSKLGLLLIKMYEISAKRIFVIGQQKKEQKSIFDLQNSSVGKQLPDPKSISMNFRKGTIPDFLRFYKAFIYLSIYLSIKPIKAGCQGLVNFSGYLQNFSVIIELERSSKMYIFVEGICLLLSHYHELPLVQEKGIILIEVLVQISQQICLSNDNICVNWQSGDLYMEKMCGQLNKIHDGDFIRLIRSSLVTLRTKFQEQFYSETMDKSINSRQKSTISKQMDKSIMMEKSFNSSPPSPQEFSSKSNFDKTRWERLIKGIIKTVRYLTSIKFNNAKDQESYRKILLELQQWFLLTPTFKSRNMILKELLITSNNLETKEQAIKASQCVQIGSTIIYGYYDKLDSTGITLITKMMAGVYVDWQDGKGFDEFQEVSQMINQLYKEQSSIISPQSFSKTIQAFAQCTNSLIADIEQTNQNSLFRPPKTRIIKMVSFILQKFTLVLTRYCSYTSEQWTFITAFFITLCSNKNQTVQQQGLSKVGQIIRHFLKEGQQHQMMKEQQKKVKNNKLRQEQILGIYTELIKSSNEIVHKEILRQLRSILLLIKTEEGLMEGFRIVKIISQKGKMSGQIYQIQEILIKDCLFRIKQIKYLSSIVEGFSHFSTDKNQQYKLVTLLWAVADHFKIIRQNINNDHQHQYFNLWKLLFQRLYKWSTNSKQPELKQSAIHAFTQILAQNINIFTQTFIMEIVNQTYLPTFWILIDIPRTQLENGPRADMAKSGIKNYIKIIRKLITQKITTKAQQCLMNRVHKKITQFLKKNNEITAQYLLQICIMIDQTIEEPTNGNLYSIQYVYELLNVIYQKMENLDQKTLIFKRKLQPLHEQLLQKLKKTQSNGDK